MCGFEDIARDRERESKKVTLPKVEGTRHTGVGRGPPGGGLVSNGTL
jgi:hypothetical protein